MGVSAPSLHRESTNSLIYTGLARASALPSQAKVFRGLLGVNSQHCPSELLMQWLSTIANKECFLCIAVTVRIELLSTT